MGSDIIYSLVQGVLVERDNAALDKYFKPYFE